MLYPTENVEDLRKLNELVSLESQVKAVRLQDKHGEQNFHENVEKAFERVTKSIEHVSQEVTKTMTEISIKKEQALEILNNKLPEAMNDRGLLATYLMSPLSKITNPENATHFKLVKYCSSARVNDLLIKNTIPITLHDKLLTFRDTIKVFELKGGLSKVITNKNYNVGLAELADKKLMYDFAKEMDFYVRCQGKKSTRDRALINLLKSPAIMASGIPNTKFLSSDSNEFCDRLKLLQ